MALATVESLASETRPDLSCLSCVIVCLSIPIFLSMLHNSPGISRMCDYSLFSKKSYNSYFYWRKNG